MKLNKNKVLFVAVLLLWIHTTSQPIAFSYNTFSEVTEKIDDIVVDDTNEFLEDIGFSESSNRYHIVNKYGYLGKYQFSYRTLKGLGYDISKKEFLSNPQIQDEAMVKLLKHNKRILENYISEWDGKIVNGVEITESGILAAAHLAGATGVKRFLNKGINKKDAFGTSVSDYMTRFSGYQLNL